MLHPGLNLNYFRNSLLFWKCLEARKTFTLAAGNQDLAEKDVHYEEEYIECWETKRFTCRWLPVHQEIKALVFLCHGYAMECSVFMRETGIRFAQAGYAVFGIDYEGHGKSDGRRCYVESFTALVNDTIAFFKSIREMEIYGNKARFLYGESMGGAVVLYIHRKEPQEWSGAILQAPMCKISEKVKPPAIFTSILLKLAEYIPSWKIVPSANIIDNAFKDPIKRQEIRANPLIYQQLPRVKTAVECLKASEDLAKHLDEVTLPFLVLHGEEDRVTDPNISRELFQTSKSCDKEFKLYPGMWHGLTAGESDDNIELVFNDIIRWLNNRSPTNARDSPLRHADVESAMEFTTPSKLQDKELPKACRVAAQACG
ncbi:caffeoylshikimate esterase isoform X2 [Physcomitrium patens]|uniref:caffeoylshikimate esterase isoform X2 n=1 Tax=Physcomitrium patens TaxID=3218 RepID=UPI003CCD6B41